MPSSTFRYTGGNTISAEMNRDRLRLLSHTSARMMKDATGTVLTAATSGAISPRSHCFHAASAASATANTVASRNPPKMRMADQADPSRTLWNLDRALTACLEPLLKESAVSLTERRYQKFRALGRGKEDA